MSPLQEKKLSMQEVQDGNFSGFLWLPWVHLKFYMVTAFLTTYTSLTREVCISRDASGLEHTVIQQWLSCH